MAKKMVIYYEESVSISSSPIAHLSGAQLDRLIDTFNAWHDSAPTTYIRRVRGRYWLAFLLLRFTGARLGEVLRVDDTTDIDYHRKEVFIVDQASSADRVILRAIPVPADVVARILLYLSEFPGMQGKVFALDQGNFRREFYRRAEEAQIPRELSHPHILRHTRAIELLRAGVPLTTVQDLLGHSLTSTTAVYLQRSEVAAGRILEEKGLL